MEKGPIGGAIGEFEKHPTFESTLPAWGATIEDEIDLKAYEFQSTLPVGGATRRHARELRWRDISIHAPRGGSDQFCIVGGGLYEYFNPRSPWGERPTGAVAGKYGTRNFNPRSPWRERPLPTMFA